MCVSFAVCLLRSPSNTNDTTAMEGLPTELTPLPSLAFRLKHGRRAPSSVRSHAQTARRTRSTRHAITHQHTGHPTTKQARVSRKSATHSPQTHALTKNQITPLPEAYCKPVPSVSGGRRHSAWTRPIRVCRGACSTMAVCCQTHTPRLGEERSTQLVWTRARDAQRDVTIRAAHSQRKRQHVADAR